MKNHFWKIALVALFCANAAQAAFTITGVSVGTQTGTLNYGTGGNVTYTLTFTGSGNGTVTVNVTGLPTGATFSPSSFASIGNNGTGTLTITTANSTPVASGQFTVTATAAGSANGNGTLTINKRSITVTAAVNNKTYDGTTSASATPTITVGSLAAGDSATLTETYNTKNVGTGKTLAPSASISNGTAGNVTASYNITLVNNTAGVISARALTITSASASKTYDGGTSSATAPSITSGAVQTGDTANFIQTYNNKNAGASKLLGPSGNVTDGNSGNNYTYTFVTNAVGTITAKTLTVSATGQNKTYDGTTATTVSLSDDRIGGDTLTTSYTSASFADKNAGAGKTVNVSGISISGTDSGNYTANSSTSTTANISARALTITAASDSKVYDGTAASSATPTVTSGAVQAGDSANFSQAFANKNVGTGKTLTPSGSVSDGNSGNNYTYTFTPVSTGAITAKALTVSATGQNKTYNGTTDATVTLSDDRISGDSLTASYTSATFADKNVANGKSVSVTGISISGTDSANYTANTTASTTANITARSLTVSATGENKTYDRTTDASVTLSDNRVSGDSLSTSYTSASFSDKNVGSGKSVSVSGISVTGIDAANYSANTSTTTTADISARSLTVTASGENKTYDGTTAATVTLSDDHLSGDTVSATYTSASFNNKHVGTAKPISVTGISLSGTDSANYSANSTASTSADISARSLTVSASGNNKTYDGTTDATVTLSDDRVSGDAITTGYTSASFADKVVGTGKAVSVSGISLSGADANDYTANTSASTTADITARTLVVSATANNKAYDGNSDATVTLSDDRISGDALTVSYTTAAFADKNVGAGKTVSVSGISVSGADSGNYSANTSTSATADITARSLAVTATGNNKVYDGTSDATVTLSDDRLSGDSLSTSYTSASFSDKNVGTGKAISVSGISITGTDAGNYTANSTTGASADITALALTVTATGQNKVYDGNADATVTLSNDALAGDTVTGSYSSASFSDKNVGAGKSVSVSGISLSGADAGNYTANTTASTSADITTRTLTISATGQNKVYDGTTDATVTLSDDAVAGDSLTTSYTTATFATEDVGTGISVSVSGISVSGADAGNYAANTTASTTANITAKTLNLTAAAQNKVYDATTDATVTLSDDRVSGDSITVGYTSAFFADKNVGTDKNVSVSGISISGTDAGNYSANTTTSTTANITAKALSVSASGQNKVYDGTANATVTLSDDRISGDSLTASYSGALFGDKNVGTSKSISVTGISLSGTDAGNYTANTTASTTADITVRTLTIGAAGQNKTYDGTTDATVTLSDDRVSGDALTTSYTAATFASRNVGAAISVSVTGISVSGADASNYSANTTATTAADITAKTLTVSATAQNRVYDGTSDATVTLSDNRISGDTLTTSYSSASFSDKNVGTGKLVSVSGISISGTDSGNYSANATASTTADITAKALVVSAAGQNKVYDGTAAATVTLSDDRISGDTLTASYSSASFNDKNVGTGKSVAVSGISISGADSGNYSANSTASTTADITAKALVVSATGQNKAYDGTSDATVTLSDDRVAGDSLSTSYSSASFSDKNVGTGKSVSVTGISVSGTDSGNYSANTTASTTADITAKALVVSAAGQNKVYDGTAAATVTLSDDRISGDVLTASYSSASFNDKNVGTGKSVSVSGISISGTDAGNYSANSTTSTTADITAKTLVVSAAGHNKVYDGTASATVTLSDDRVSGDSLSTSYSSASFSDKNVATGKTVNVSGISVSGTDAGNYSANSTTSTTADITAATLTATADDKSRAYGAANPTFTGTYSGFVSGEDETIITGTLSGTTTAIASSPVGAYPISISGVSAPNYTINFVDGTLNITGYPLTVTSDSVSRAYGSANPTFTGNLSGVQAGDNITADFTTAATAGSPVGSYPIVPTFNDPDNKLSNYSITTNAGNLTVTQVNLTVTAQNQSRAYGSTNLPFTATYTGFVNDDDESVLTGSPAFTTLADTNSLVSGSPYAISVSTGTLSATNYSFSFVNGELTVTPAPLTITPDDTNRIYGAANPAFTGVVSGIQNGDSITASYDSSATTNSAVGPYAIEVTTVSDPDGKLPNYTVTTNSGTLNVTAATLTVVAGNASRTYGDTNPTFTGTLTGVQNNDNITATFETAATEASSVGTYDIVSSLTDPDNKAGNYTLLATNGTLTVSAAPLTVTANDASRAVGASNPTFTGTTDGLKNGDTVTVVYSTDATEASVAGEYDIVPNVSGAALSNYSLTTVNGTLSVLDGVSVSVSPTSVTLNQGEGTNFVASITGFGDIQYQWSLNGTPIVGATSSTYVITNALVADAGTYAVEVSNEISTNSATAVLNVIGDSTAPIVKVLSPKANFIYTTNPVVALNGTALDFTRVVQVRYNFNNAGYVTVSNLTYVGVGKPTNWNGGTLTLVPGTNTLQVQAVDIAGNVGSFSSKMYYHVSSLLTVNVTGQGTVLNLAKPFAGDNLHLFVGRGYRMQAYVGAGTNFVLTNVTYTAAGGESGEVFVNSNAAPKVLVNFNMKTNMALTYTFIDNPLTPASGSYQGLFGGTNASHQSAGYISFKVTPKFTYTGKIYVDGNIVPFKGKLNISGFSTTTVSRVKVAKSDLQISLRVNWDGTNTITGTVSDPTAGWTVDMLADRKVWTVEQSATAYTNRYTLTLPGSTDKAQGSPGYSYGTFSIDPLGTIVMIGYTADGVATKQQTYLSKDGYFPFFAPVYSVKIEKTILGVQKIVKETQGEVRGWLQIKTNSTTGILAPEGSLTWIKTGWTNLYSGGFTNNEVAIVGSRWLTSAPMLSVTNASVTLSDGNLSAPYTADFTITPKNAALMSLPLVNKTKTTFAPKLGTFKGSFTHPSTATVKLYFGAMLQDYNYGRGFFNGVDEGGVVTLQTR